MASPRRQQAADDYDDDEGPAYVDDDHRAIAEFAESYLDEDERESFVEHLLDRRGYQRISGWGPPQQPAGPPEPPEPPEPPAPGPGQSRRPGGQRRPRRADYFKR